jgi:hypothetical protein
MPPNEPHLRRDQYRTFKYLAGFVSEWTRLGLGDEPLLELENLILSNPERGPVMTGTGGLRKLRFSPSAWGKGKSGSLRIGYSHHPSLEKIFMIAVYAKNEQSNLTRAERKEIKRLLTLLWEKEAK